MRRTAAAITDTSVAGESPYANYARQGAAIRPRRLFLVQETENTAVINPGHTITVNPRLGSLDNRPWKDLDLSAITTQTIERAHVYDVYLNETLVPYATLEPLKAVLPVKRGDHQLPTDANGVGGVRLGGLERRMRERWQTISGWWESNKSAGTKDNLLESLDHYRKLSSQLEWIGKPDDRPIRVVQSQGGQPTAALLQDDNALVDEALYWIACKDMQEAYYLLAIINSDTLYEAVQPLMSKGQFGARNLHKQLWKLPIPEFDAGDFDHQAVAEAGYWAVLEAAHWLEELRPEYGERLTVTIARRELRKRLRDSRVGAVVEGAVENLLGWPEGATEEALARRAERDKRYGLSGGIDSGTLIRANRQLRDYELDTKQPAKW